ENTLKTHELYPVDISYVQLGHRTQQFEDLLGKNQYLANSFQNQFIIGTRYSYTLNTQLNEDRENDFKEREFERWHFYFNGTIDVAGNLVNLVQRNFSDDSESLKIFGTPYSQFVRGQIDVRYFFSFDKNNKLATRLILGTGYAYRNSTTMPYIKQFSIGGSNSIRAFPARTIGPGTFNVQEQLPAEE